MTPLIQKIISGDEKRITGESFRACICSLLNIENDGIANFVDDPEYPSLFLKFIHCKNMEIYFCKEPPNHVEYYIGFGMSPRGIRHSVIYKDTTMVHDPHPDGGGIVPDTYAWLQYDN